MSKNGLLIVNLGSPDAPTAKAVRRYLKQFLTDPYVIDIPWLARQLLVRGVIAPFRAPKSAEAYSKVWRPEGSPLKIFTQKFAEAVSESLGREDWSVRWAMRYGSPSMSLAMKDWDVERIFLVPMYPQYAESSTRTALDEAIRARAKVPVFYLRDFFVHPEFIRAQAGVIADAATDFRPDHILLSFHGLPKHHLTKLHPRHCFVAEDCCARLTDENALCYRAQCLATVRALTPLLPLAKDRIVFSFQSRLGRRPWIEPYSDVVIEDLARSGARRVLVSCPSFVADCLETLEEVAMRLRDQFIAAGGEDLRLVPALNDTPDWIRGFSAIVRDPLTPWRELLK